MGKLGAAMYSTKYFVNKLLESIFFPPIAAFPGAVAKDTKEPLPAVISANPG